MVGNSVPVILVGTNSEQGRISSCRIIKFHSTSNMSVKTEKQQEEGKVRIKTLPLRQWQRRKIHDSFSL